MTAAEPWQDTFLDPSLGYADTVVTLGDIYFALPQKLFDIPYRQRFELLLGGFVQFDRKGKQIFIPGDGAQSTLTIHIVEQSHEKLILDVLAKREDATLHYMMSRTPSGWDVTEKH